jgi:uncharacterized membrane protein (DUF485 family)
MRKRRGSDAIDGERNRPLALEAVQLETRERQGAAAAPHFQRLIAIKRRTIIPMMAFSMVFFFGVTLLFGYQRAWMGLALGGGLNLGYALILATYGLCWVIALVYFAVATYWFDPQVRRAIAERDGEALKS